MSRIRLSKEDEDFFNKYRNPDGSPLSEVQKEAMIDILARFKTLDLGKEKEPEEVKIIDKSKQPKSVEDLIYAKARTPQTRANRDSQDLERELRSSGVEITQSEEVQIDLSQYQPQEVFILKYDDFGKELLRKSNLKFRGTKAEVPARNLKQNQEIPKGNILVRSAYLTTIVQDEELRNLNIVPITPLQSEALFKDGKLPKDPSTYWEDLALILYDHSDKGINPKEAKALFESLKEHKEDLELTDKDLEERLLIINPGLEVDSSFQHGVKPVVLQGVTKAYAHETLKRTSKDHKFSYGTEKGLPSANQLRGSRTLWMPSENENIGLRVLFRSGDSGLDARYVLLDYSDVGGRVSFAKKSA